MKRTAEERLVTAPPRSRLSRDRERETIVVRAATHYWSIETAMGRVLDRAPSQEAALGRGLHLAERSRALLLVYGRGGVLTARHEPTKQETS